jgi:AcrR family transcriptional regulator
MVRLTRAESQEHNRARVLAAARAEFAERGFRAAKIDAIAERAELTRGAVYSNFPGKRALYFAVLAEVAAEAPEPAYVPTAGTPEAALADFARASVARLPLSTDEPVSAARLDGDLLAEIEADRRTSLPYAQLLRLGAIVLGLALEQIRPTPARMVRVAELAVTLVQGASRLAAAAPGFGEPFDVISACRRLPELDLGDRWDPPHLPYVPRARRTDEPWSPPAVTDALRLRPARLTGDGVVAVLGLHRLAMVEEAARATPPGNAVTAVLVSGDPAEYAALGRLVVTDLRAGLLAAFPAQAWPRLQIVHDDTGALAAAAGVPAFSDATETAIRVAGGRIVARADGYGACHAVATSSD